MGQTKDFKITFGYFSTKYRALGVRAKTGCLGVRIMGLSGITCLPDLLAFVSFVMDLILWQFHLQLPVQSVPITTKVVSSNPIHGEMYSIQPLCDIVCQ